MNLNKITRWEGFTYTLVRCYNGRAKQGRPGYDPEVLLKMLLLSYLYDISERQTEQVAKLDLAPKESLGLGLPAHTIAADRRYDGSGNHCLLRSLGLHSAIRLNQYRTRKKDENKRGWIALLYESEHIRGQKSVAGSRGSIGKLSKDMIRGDAVT